MNISNIVLVMICIAGTVMIVPLWDVNVTAVIGGLAFVSVVAGAVSALYSDK